MSHEKPNQPVPAAHEEERLKYLDHVRQTEVRRLQLEKEIDLLAEKYEQAIEERRSSAKAYEGQIEKLLREKEGLLREIGNLGVEMEKNRASSRDELAKSQRDAIFLRHEVASLRGDVARAQQAALDVRETLSFRLGYILNHMFKSRKNFREAPAALWELHREGARRRAKKRAREDMKLSEAACARIEAVLRDSGADEAAAYIKRDCKGEETIAAALTWLARKILTTEPDKALAIAREACGVSPRPFRRKWLAFLLFDAGHITEAKETLAALPADTPFQASERNKAKYIEGCHALLSRLPALPAAPPAPLYAPKERSVLYIAASTLPFHVSGYTLRTHHIVADLISKGWNVLCASRPGYPADRNDADVLQPGKADKKVVYATLDGPHRRKVGLDAYIEDAAAAIAEKAAACRAAVIHAASNYEAALPALMAARSLGIPFVYEVRGLWEYTAASKMPGWEGTERFALDKKLESFTAAQADRVLTLTEALAGELAARGTPRDRIDIVPNAVDPTVFESVAREDDLARQAGLRDGAFVIGYAGSVVSYEGLDDLVTAFARLRGTGADVQLLIVGDGTALAGLQEQARESGAGEDILFTGRVAPEEVPRYYALFDLMVLPRKPVTVCEIVSPLKPFEAMAAKVPLLMSDVAALREISGGGRFAATFRAGDASALYDAMASLAGDRDLLKSRIDAACRHVCEHHTWDSITQKIHDVYALLTQGAPAGVSAPLAGYAAPETHGTVSPIVLPPGKNSFTAEEKIILDQKIAEAYGEGGVAAVRGFIGRQCAGRSEKFRAFCMTKAAFALLERDEKDAACALTEEAAALDPTLSTIRSACRFYNQAAMTDEAEAAALRLKGMTDAGHAGDANLIAESLGRANLARWAAAPAASRGKTRAEGKRVLNVLSFSLPYASVGYATRSHGLALGIRDAGYDIRPYTRPGFPYDFKDDWDGLTLPQSEEIDGITYRRLFDVQRKGQDETAYMTQAVSCLEQAIDAERPEIVHAASNYVTALPALIAAKRRGVPFIYEIRGFWEITRSSRDEDFAHTPKYRQMEYFEALVTRHADHIITITTAMKNELVARGVAAEKISIAYNSVDPRRFTARPRNAALAERLSIPAHVPVIGYVGSFVDYEGLDDLIEACGALAREGYDFRLLLVGDGAAKKDMERQIAKIDALEGRAILTGRVPHEEVEDYYTLIDIAPFPRKPWQVCEMVSPLKPFEAMALEKAVVVSGTDALLEIVSDGETGLVFAKGDTGSLQAALARLIDDAVLRAQLGGKARAWIERERSWDKAGRTCAEIYARFTG